MLEIVVAVLTVVIALLVIILYKWHDGLAKYKLIPGPNNNSLSGFFLGNLNEILDLSDGKAFPEKMLEWYVIT
jgi:hypothetical protein